LNSGGCASGINAKLAEMKKIKNHPFLQINPVRGGFAAGGI